MGEMTAEELLETSPFEGELGGALAARPARSVQPGLTVYLGAGVILVAGFIGGIQADQHWGSASSAAGGAAGAGAARQGAPGTGQGGQGGAGGLAGQGRGQGGGSGQGSGGTTFGTVKMVDGSTVYVETPSGIVAVKTDASTKIRISKDGTVKDLPPGSAVVVQGMPGGDGSVTAGSITQGGGFGTGRPGFGGGGGQGTRQGGGGGGQPPGGG